jgi:hypothetical protein
VGSGLALGQDALDAQQRAGAVHSGRHYRSADRRRRATRSARNHVAWSWYRSCVNPQRRRRPSWPTARSNRYLKSSGAPARWPALLVQDAPIHIRDEDSSATETVISSARREVIIGLVIHS